MSHGPKTLVRFDFPPGAGPKEIAAAIREAGSRLLAEKLAETKAREEAASRSDESASDA